MTISTLRCLLIGSFLGFSLESTQNLWSQAPVSISGRVYDAASNRTLPAVRISTLSFPSGAKGPVASTARSLDDGSFTLAVALGRHTLCIDAGEEYLDPCQWSPGTTVVDTARSLTVNFPLRKGVLVIVRVADPNGAGLAARKASPVLSNVPAPPVSVMIADASGSTRPIPFRKSDGTNSEFSLLVPPEMDFNLSVSSPRLTLGDEAGNLLSQNQLQAPFMSPVASADFAQPSLLSHRLGPNLPSRVFRVTIIGLR